MPLEQGPIHLTPPLPVPTQEYTLAWFRSAFRHMPVAAAITTLKEGRFLAVNRHFEEVFGFSEAELLGRPSDEFSIWAEAEDRARVVALLRAGKPVQQLEAAIRSKDGRSGWVSYCADFAIIDGIECLLSGAVDITERKQAEQVLRSSEDRFRSLIEQSPVALAMTSGIETLYLNRKFKSLFGLTDPGGGVGASILDRVAPECRASILERVRRRAEGLPVPEQFDTKALHADGTVFPIQVAVAVIQFPHGPETMFFISDLTERVEAETQRLGLLSRLQQSQKMESLGSLAGGIAHDMNNVLAAILAQAAMQLVRLPPTDGAYATFETIQEAATRGGRMVKGLLDFARQRPRELRVFNLNDVLVEEVRLLEHMTLAKVRLDLDLDPGLQAMRGDADELAHAVMNLCVNAVDAMEAGGTLTLRTRNEGADRVVLTVADTGCGMPPQVLEKALDPFFTTKPVGKGTGLGLAMVYATVKAHQGQLELDSAPGQGTRVRLLFPAGAMDAAAEPAAPRPGQEAGPALAVLIVDDDDMVLEATRMLVAILGHDVTAASSGEQALRLLEQGLRPDLVLLDLNMPGLGGQGTLPRLRALCPDLPVLLATGRADQAALDLVASDANLHLLPKPFTLPNLQVYLAGLPG